MDASPSVCIESYGTLVDVYKNLHRDCWSVRCASSRLVIGHADTVFLKDAVPKISEAGRQRVIKEGRKNVHAVLRGVLADTSEEPFLGLGMTYNPYERGRFSIVSMSDWGFVQGDVLFKSDGKAYACICGTFRYDG